jgi:hypothetical protein
LAEKWRVQKSFWNTTSTWEVRPVSSNDQLRIPDSHLCAEVTELVRESSPEYLFNHSLRSFYFASLLPERRKTRLDVEVLYLGTIMHDIGLVEGMIHEPRRFEVVGADFARSHLLEQGLDERRADVVWDVIALHSSVGIADYKGVEVALAHLGISVDVVGRGLEELTDEQIESVLELAPRLRFTDDFLDLLAQHVKANPHVSMFNFLDDVARHRLEHHASPNFVDLFLENPLNER